MPISDGFDLAARYGIVPVINIPCEELAVPLAAALTEGGLPLIEVTMRNDSAMASLARIKRECPQMTAGAGTVLSVAQADEAIAVGADFIVAPGFNPEVVEHCIKKGIPILPGCSTATEIEMGLKMGLKTFKFFPAELQGGVRTIKELCGPYRNIRFIATSGICMENIADYLSCKDVAAVGGSFMAPAALVQAEDFAAITRRCHEAVRLSHGFQLMHIGLNGANADEGTQRAERFAAIFDLPYHAGNRSDFAGSILESCKMKFPGAHGHIAIGTYSVERAVAYLQAKGITIREEFKNIAPDGQWIAAYLEEEIGGFAIHLLRRG